MESIRRNRMYIHFGFEKIADLLINSPNISEDNKEMLKKFKASLHQLQSISFWLSKHSLRLRTLSAIKDPSWTDIREYGMKYMLRWIKAHLKN